MQYLCAVEPARPWEVLAITFTHQAANELKDRLEKMLGEEARDVWAATFHSACVRILRRDIGKIGFDRSFTIYDTDDSKRVIKDILKEMGLEEKTFPVREVLSVISNAKDAMNPATHRPSTTATSRTRSNDICANRHESHSPKGHDRKKDPNDRN